MGARTAQSPAARERLDRVRVVLVRPLYSGNLGSAARAMANCGLSRLVLVSPVADPHADDARRMAVLARPILENARIEPALDRALDGTILAVATTVRGRSDGVASVSPAQAATAIVDAASRGDVAILFGPEDEGLCYDDLRPCALRIAIPTAPDYTSLNLAQAVLLVGHYVWIAASCPRALPAAIPTGKDGADAGAPAALSASPASSAVATLSAESGSPAASGSPAPSVPRPASFPAATFEEVQGALEHLTRVLDRVGFLNPQNPDQGFEVLRHLIVRAGLSLREVRTMRGMLRQIEWALTSGPRTRSS